MASICQKKKKGSDSVSIRAAGEKGATNPKQKRVTQPRQQRIALRSSIGRESGGEESGVVIRPVLLIFKVLTLLFITGKVEFA